METLISLIHRWREHGESVNRWYKELCTDPSGLNCLEAEQWFSQYQPIDLSEYHINHDIGKPYCIEYDEDGKAHYPNHSAISHQTYCDTFNACPNSMTAQLILHDMDFHTARGEQICETWKLPFSDHLMATAWAELEANAELFGGRDSTSYKIKRKQLLKCLKRRPK